MTNSLIVLGVMLAILVAGSFMRKIPVAVLLVVASIAGAVVGGMTDPLLKRDYFRARPSPASSSATARPCRRC